MLRGLDSWLRWRLVGFEPSGAQSLYQTVITLTLSFIVFTFSSLLVAIQVASAQLTPRIIATTLLRDNRPPDRRAFLLTLAFDVGVLLRRRIGALPVAHRRFCGLSIAAFLYLIDHAARLLRPVSIVWRIGEGGLTVLEQVYPEPEDAHAGTAPRPLGPPVREVLHRGTSASSWRSISSGCAGKPSGRRA